MPKRAFHVVAALLAVAIPAFAQDESPLRDRHVWLPMTGATDAQMDDARAAGYDAVLLKVRPPVLPNGSGVDPATYREVLQRAGSRGFKAILAILGWAALDKQEFADFDEEGNRIAGRLDPFHPEAMRRVEWYFAEVIKLYARDRRVIAFAPTWGIFGEAGFTSQSAGRSPHALARFNEWRKGEGLPPLKALPTGKNGPDSDYSRFIRFRYLYLERAFDAMVARLRKIAGGRPVGMWQELYPVDGYQWTMVEVPSADFALYESCFPFQSVHHPEKSLAETMGFRYKCASADDYRDYYLPLVARKRGEGQRFAGCQLSNGYAANYGWTAEKAAKMEFEKWEDRFGPVLAKLHAAPLESPPRDVLLVFPSYAAAALTPRQEHGRDVMLVDVFLRAFGAQMERYGTARFDKLGVRDLNRYKLIVVPCAEYIVPATYEKLKKTEATVLFTGAFARSFDGEYTEQGRALEDRKIRYLLRPGGPATVAVEDPLTRSAGAVLKKQPVTLAVDEIFAADGLEVLLKCGEFPLLSRRTDRRWVFLHGHLFASVAHRPGWEKERVGGSKDASANEIDWWGPYDATLPANEFSFAVMRDILDFAEVAYRVPDPPPLVHTRYLGENMEAASVSANLAYNNTDREITLRVRLGRKTREVAIPAFSYKVLR